MNILHMKYVVSIADHGSINQAAEEYLIDNFDEDIVMLWRNDNTTGTQPSAIISHVSVMEGAPCKTPTGLLVTGQTNDYVTIGWDADPDAGFWECQYGLVDSDLVVTLTTDTNSITIERNPEMPHGSLTYWLLVRADCGGGNVSDWSDTLTAQILNVGVASPLENCVRVFPNPAQEAVNVQWTIRRGIVPV